MSFYDVASRASASVDKALSISFPILGTAVEHVGATQSQTQQAAREWSRGHVEAQLAHARHGKRLRHDAVLDHFFSQAVLSPCYRAHFLIKS